MKKIIFYLALFMSLSCKAQTPILSLFDAPYGAVPRAYYKDLDHDFDRFVGTWVYTGNNVSLTIVLQKKVLIYNSTSDLYEDLLIGEYKYIENGVEKINTLSFLNASPADLMMHNIYGSGILRNYSAPVCRDCSENERRVGLLFSDPTRANIEGLTGSIIMRHVISGNVQKIEARIIETGNILYQDGGPLPLITSFNVPFGSYVLTKQQ